MQHDADIRPHLLALLKQQHSAPGTYLIEELDMRDIIADVVVAGDDLQAFEIKAERDTLRRLPRQAEHYNRLFDSCCLVTTASHANAALQILPGWWGLMLASEGGALTWARPCGANPAVDRVALCRILWKHELLAILKRVGAARGLSTARWEAVRQRFLDTFPDLDDVRREVREVIKANEARRLRNMPFVEEWRRQILAVASP